MSKTKLNSAPSAGAKGKDGLSAPKVRELPKGMRLPFIMRLIIGLGVFFALPALSAMAVAKYAVIVLLPEGQKRSGASGSLVWKRNDTMRVWAIPRLVRNYYTGLVRSSFTALNNGWRSLAQSEQDAWNGTEVTTRNVYGKPVINRGKTAYVSTGRALATVGQPPLTLPVPFVGLPTTLPKSVDMGTGNCDMTLNDSNIEDAPVNFIFTVYATKGLSLGVNRPGTSQFRLLGTIDGGTAPVGGSYDLLSMYETKYGAPSNGVKIFFALGVTDSNTGECNDMRTTGILFPPAVTAGF